MTKTKSKAKSKTKTAAKDPAKPRARAKPVHYSRVLADRICRRLAGGETLRKICRSPGMPDERAVRTWAFDDRDGFAAKYARARELGYQVWADEVIDLSDDSTGDYVETGKDENGEPILKANYENVNRSRLRVDSRKWLLSKALPKIYGDKTDVTLRNAAPSEPTTETDKWLQGVVAESDATNVVPLRTRTGRGDK